MARQRTKNQGEGNVGADRRYRRATREFVDSGKVDEAAEKAADMNDRELADARSAEDKGKARGRA